MYTETGMMGFDFIKNDPVSFHQIAKIVDESANNQDKCKNILVCANLYTSINGWEIERNLLHRHLISRNLSAIHSRLQG